MLHKNCDVNSRNKNIFKESPGKYHIYISFDRICDVHQVSAEVSNEFVTAFKVPGILSHILYLKTGEPSVRLLIHIFL